MYSVGFLACWILFVFSGCAPELREPEWNRERGYRWADLTGKKNNIPGLVKISSSHSKVRIQNILSEDRMNANRVLMNGSGVAAGDVDGDGLPDLYFARLEGGNKLYRNLGGFRFEDITDRAGVAHRGHFSTGVVFADVNGNGHLDLLVTAVDSENVLYLNDGTGHFQRKEDSGLGPSRGSMTMALADITGNGFPDLYIVNYRETNVLDQFDAGELLWENTVRDGQLIPPFDDYFAIIDRGDDFSPERHEIGREDELYLNKGDGTFEKVTDPETRFLTSDGEPLGLYPDWGLAAKFHDLNGNGFPDLYVCNDFWTPDRIWINQGDGTFRALDTLAVRNTSYYSMTTDFSDINRDGYPDIFTVEMLHDRHNKRLQSRLPVEPLPLRMGEYRNRPRYNRNSLFLNRGDHTYAEISYYTGLEASGWSWATRFVDLDLDGYEDVLINNGFAFDFQNLDAQQRRFSRLLETRGMAGGYEEQFPVLKQQNRIFRNNGDLTFTDVSREWGFTDTDISLGMALADLNGDGTQDVVISRMNAEPLIYNNRPAGSRIAVRLKGKSPNTQAIGAAVELSGGPVEGQTKQIISGGDYLSGSDPLIVFAGDEENVSHTLRITWPDGTENSLDGIRSDRIYEIFQEQLNEAGGQNASGDSPSPEPPRPLFEDVTARLGHTHHEDPFDDFRIQPLLPYTLSRQGPGMAWFDMDGNGLGELIIGSGKGGTTGVYKPDERGEWESVTSPVFDTPATGDQTGIVGWKANGYSHLIVGMSNYEQGTSRAAAALHYQLEEGRVMRTDSLPGTLSATGPLTAADYTGDGNIDLFIGGRFLPGQYPGSASSRLFKYENGNWTEDQENNALLEEVGLVSGAIFVDYNGSGEQDLILTTEWGTIRVFENSGGRFTERTAEVGLEKYTGWWQGVTAGDFTGNGFPDLVVTNMGENSPYKIKPNDRPLRIYYGDFNRDRRMDLIESYYDSSIGGYVPRRSWQQFESIKEALWHIQSHQQFSEMTVAEILNEDMGSLPFKEINTLRHLVLLNHQGKYFTTHPLPAPVQFSAGFYAGVADADNDGYEDIFISQNFFGVARPQSTPRLDAGRGIWLKGNGDGSFEPVPGHQSGVKVYGEQRGAVLGDFTRNGRIDLAVSQNSAETRLFLNRSEKRGIRVELRGPESNATGIGSRVRLVYENETKGPARFIQSGSGYWSQNSTSPVLGFSALPVSVEVTWYDGVEQTVKLEKGRLNVVVFHPETDGYSQHQ